MQQNGSSYRVKNYTKCLKEIWGKSTFVRVSARFELTRVRVIGSQLYIFLCYYNEPYYFIWHSSLPRNKTLELKTIDVQCFYFVWAFCSKRYVLDDVLVFSRLGFRCSLWFGLVPLAFKKRLSGREARAHINRANKLLTLPRLSKTWIAPSNGQIALQWITRESNCPFHWIEICTTDSAIHLLNWGLVISCRSRVPACS